MRGNTDNIQRGFWRRAFYLYYDGFRSLSVTSKILWVLIIFKLIVMFAILRPFFFPNIVKQQGDKEQQAAFVLQQITQEKNTP